METLTKNDLFKSVQSNRPKKQILVRKKIDESIAAAKQLEKHPFLQNTLIEKDQQNIGNFPAQQSKKAFTRAGDMLRRVSKMLTKNVSDSRVLTQQSQRSIDSNIRSKHFSNVGTQNFQQQQQENNYVCEIDGPQVKMNKQFISFMALRGKVAFDEVIVTNNGNASIYYEWESLENQKNYQQSLQERDQKFFCHHEQNVIKPGEQKRFIFSFLSKLTGIFNQEWVLNCSPPTTKPLARLKLSGHAIQIDENIEWRHQFDRQLYESHLYKGMKEILDDIIVQVKTPTPPLPNLDDPEVCKQEFEQKNKNLGLFYNPLVIKWWRDLENSIYEELKKDPETMYWDMDILYLKNLINEIYDDEVKYNFMARYKNYEELSRKRPVERSLVYNDLKQKLLSIIDKIPETSDQLREENQLWDYQFLVPSDDEADEDQQQEEDIPEPTEEMSEEEQQQLIQLKEEYLKKQEEKNLIKQQKQEAKQKKDEELAKLKADWAKKRKKKINEEEEKNLLEQVSNQIIEQVSQQALQLFDNYEQYSEYLKIDQQLEEFQPNDEYFEQIMKKMQVSDADIDGRRILLKVHLTCKTDPESILKKQQFEQQIIQQKEEEVRKAEEERLLQEQLAKDKKKGRRPQPQKKKKGQADEIPKEQKPLDLSFLEEQNLKNIVDQIKFFIEKQAKLVMLLPSFNSPTGEYSLVQSTKFFFEYLKNQIDSPVYFNESLYIDNFEEKMETEFYSDNSVLVLENSFFEPMEIGFRVGKKLKDEVLQQEIQRQKEEKEQKEEIERQLQEEQAENQQNQSQNKNKNKQNKSLQEEENKEKDKSQVQEQEKEEKNVEFLEESEILEKYSPDQIEDYLIKFDNQEREEFQKQLNEYGHVFVVEDQYNFFKNFSSLIDTESENNVLGNCLGKEVMNSAYLNYLKRDPEVVFLGGKITPNKLIALNNFYKTASRIVLLGEFGIAQYLNQQKKESITGLPTNISQIKRKYLQKIIDQNSDQNVELVVPSDFLTAKEPKQPIPEGTEEKLEEKNAKKEKKPKTNAKDAKKEEQTIPPQEEDPNLPTIPKGTPEYYEFLLKNLKNWEPHTFYVQMGENQEQIQEEDLEHPLENNYTVIDYGEHSLLAIKDSLEIGKKVVWIDNLSLHQENFENQNQEQFKQLEKKIENQIQYMSDPQQQPKSQQQKIKFEQEQQQKLQQLQEQKRDMLQKQQLLQHCQKQLFLNLTIQSAKQLFYLQEKKLEKLQICKQDPLYDFAEDQVVFILGQNLKLELNQQKLKETPKKKKKKTKKKQSNSEFDENSEQEENLEEEEENLEDQEENLEEEEENLDDNEENLDENEENLDENENEDDDEENVNKKKKYNPARNMQILADFFINDTEFALRIANGEYVQIFNNLNSVPINTEPDIDEGLSFLDEIPLEDQKKYH